MRNSFKATIVAVCLAFLFYGCGATRPQTSHDREKAPLPTTQKVQQEPASRAPQSEQIARQEPAVPTPASPLTPVSGSREPEQSMEVTVDFADIEFVQQRLKEYERKYEHWLELSAVEAEEALADEVDALDSECIQQLERILTGYSVLLERMEQNTTVPFDKRASIDPKKLQKLDIAFLESRCSKLLTMEIPIQYQFMPEPAPPELSFDAAQETIASLAAQGNYQELLLAFGRLSQDFPNQQPSLFTQLNYGLALQYTGQIEEAAKHFESLLISDDLYIDPFSLQREIADLLLANGNVAAAESYYESIILAHETAGTEKTWAEEQLALLHTVDPGSEEMAAYIKLLREFQVYDYKIFAPELNEAIHSFTATYADSPVAESAMRLKAFAMEQLKSWFSRQLAKIDALVAAKKFAEATDILKNMSRYYLPADLQAIVQKTYYEVAQSEIQEEETQRRIQEMELTEQWNTAVNFLDSQQYDNAIAAFQALVGTEYEEEAKMKITETANRAATQMRKEAASLFIRAGKADDPEQKKELLLASYGLLTAILDKYPQTDLLEKVQQNRAILEVQIQRYDPSMLEELQQKTPADSPPDSSGPYSRQRW